ncbi:MAG: GNAT family N-acetyltransferase [Planctomycetota bacterium]
MEQRKAIINFEKAKIRNAVPGDVDAVLGLIQRVFTHREDAMAVIRDLLSADKQLKVYNFRLMEYEDRLVGIVCTQRRLIQFGSAKLLCGDVGYVSVEPKMHGCGLGTLLMQDNSRFLKEHGFHIARLGGLARFYSRFGWSSICNHSWRFKLSDVKTGASVISFTKFIGLDSEDRSKIRPMDKSRDWQQCLEVCKLCHTQSYWYEPLDSPFVELQKRRVNDIELKRWVYEENGSIKAYLMVANDQNIFDAAWRPQNHGGFVALLKYSMGIIKQTDPQIAEIRASLPWKYELMQAVAQAGLKYELVETYDAKGSTMVKAVDLKTLMKSFICELQRRIKVMPELPASKFVIELTDASQQVGINLSDMSVFEPGSDSELTYSMSQTDFMTMLIGAKLPSRLNINVRPNSQSAIIFIDSVFGLQNTVGP